MSTLRIPARFNGPPHSANGGWFAGAIAEHLAPGLPRPGAPSPAVTVRLSAPPPLEVDLSMEPDGEGIRLTDGDTHVAVANLSEPLSRPSGTPVTFAEARAAGSAYEGLTEHPFSTCFSCGTAREDGLSLRPAAVGDGSGAYAAAWVPREVSVRIGWAALDCPGGWSAGIAGRPMVLGTMTAQLFALPAIGQECVVMAWPGTSSGRRFESSSALYGPSGELLGTARAVWIAVNPAAVRPVGR